MDRLAAGVSKWPRGQGTLSSPYFIDTWGKGAADGRATTVMRQR